MRATIPILRAGWWGALLMLIASSLVAAEENLFPIPLHLLRRVEDPISKTSVELDEYYSGNKVISVRGGRTAIVDYERQEMLEIDRDAGTYSVARFDEIAKSKAATYPRPEKSTELQATGWKTTALGLRAAASGSSVDSFEITSTKGEKVRVEIGIDRRVLLSREALDVLLGAAYPNTAPSHHDSLARTCSQPSTAISSVATQYALPVEQSITYDVPHDKPVTIRTSILKVTNDLPPPEVLAIPAGAKLVESRAALLLRLSREFDSQQETQRP